MTAMTKATQLYYVRHHHRFGHDLFFVESDHVPSVNEVVKSHNIEFERNREDEYIAIGAINNVVALPSRKNTRKCNPANRLFKVDFAYEVVGSVVVPAKTQKAADNFVNKSLDDAGTGELEKGPSFKEYRRDWNIMNITETAS